MAEAPGRRSAPAALVLALSVGAALALAGSGALALAGRTERGEWLLFLLIFAAALPTALLGAWRLERKGRATWSRAGAAAAGAATLIVVARALHRADVSGKAPAAALLLAAAALVIAVLVPLAPRQSRVTDQGRVPAPRAIGALAVAGVGGLPLGFLPPGSLTAPKVAIAALAAVAAAALYAGVRRLPNSPRAGPALDVAVSLAVLLLVVDVVGYTADGPVLSSGSGLVAENVVPAAQLHLDYYLGPVNDVLHGRELLVDSACQYGVLNVYALAAWSDIAPLGYGPLGFFVGLFTAAQYLAAYWIARLAGCGRLIAAGATLIAVVVTVLAAFGSPNFFPSTGGLRFGLPFLLMLVALLAARRSPSATPASPVALVVVALAAVWSAETLVYALAAFAALLALDVALQADSPRSAARLAGGHLARVAVAVATAHVLFAVATRAFAGRWPDWGWYLDYFETYSTGGLSQALASPWSPAWLVGATYFASLAGLAALVATNRTAALERRLPLLAIAGTSGVGLAFFTYFLGRSLDLLLPFVALPAFVLVGIWLSLALQADGLPRAAKVATVGVCSWLAALALALAWPQAGDRLPRTALAHAFPGGRSLNAALRGVWDSPPMDPRTPSGERMIRDHFPGSRPALVIAEPSLAQEILVRTGRIGTLPISFPWEDDLVYERSVKRVRAAVARLRPGTPMLLQPDAARARSAPPPVGVVAVIGGRQLARVQLAALDAIKRRFALERVVRGEHGLEVVRLRRKTRG